MNTHAIVVSPPWVRHEVTEALRQRRGVRVEVNAALQHCDFACGASSVLYHDATGAVAQREPAALVTRVQEARQRCGTQPVVLMVRLDAAEEPSLASLSWFNLECGVAHQCGLVLVWSADDAAQFLASLAASAVTSLEFSGTARSHVGDAPLPVLIDALTQTPQVVTRNDVVRIANRASCMAEVLMSEAQEWEGIAGFGRKKAARLQHLFRTPFLSSQQRVDSLVSADSADAVAATGVPRAPEDVAEPSLAGSLSSTAAATDGRRRMMDVLQQRRDAEDEDS
ncbi:hypothetical protein NESM_000591100 [Novymonas esmeraldas]|uniref:DNA repair protein n=1 Tax=Novymonas esmeraldas TaxID=1808958 RepID=A0AAW0ESZ5_9TRYP